MPAAMARAALTRLAIPAEARAYPIPAATAPSAAVARLGHVRGKPELLTHQAAHTRRRTGQEQPDPPARIPHQAAAGPHPARVAQQPAAEPHPGRVAEPGVGQGQGGGLRGQLLHRAGVLHPRLGPRPVVKQGRLQPVSYRPEHPAPGHREVMEFGRLGRPGEPARHADDRDRPAVIPPLSIVPPPRRFPSNEE